MQASRVKVAPRVGQPAARPTAPVASNTRKPAAPARAPVTSPTAPTPGKKQSNGAPQAYIVSSKAVRDDIGISTLVGEYVESGKNHGRSLFKRTQDSSGGSTMTVFLYYWDLRDGADFSGWWFGDKVGGTEVWARCAKTDNTPPQTGWRVPWDGKVQPDLVVEPKKAAEVLAEATGEGTAEATVAAKVEALEAKEEMADAAVAPHIEIDERVQRATDRVVIAEIEATQALESVSAMMEGEVSEDSLKVVEELLQAQWSSMTETHKVLAADIMDARKSAPKTVTSLNNLTPRVRIVQASLAQEMKHAKQMLAQKKKEAEDFKARAKAEEAQTKAEQRDAKALEEALPDAMELVQAAEDTLNAVTTAASPLTDFGEQPNDSIMLAIKDTEAAVAKAKEAIEGAQAAISTKITAAKEFAPEAKKVAMTEYVNLQEKLNEAQKKLAPYAHVRKDYEQRLEGKKVLTEVAQKLGTVEVEVEKVTSMLSANPLEEEMSSAESSLPPVATTLASVMKLVDKRVQSATGRLKEDLLHLQERGNSSKKKLDAFRAQLRSLTEQREVQALLRQGLEKTQAAEEALAQTAVAEAPFLRGIEMVPGAEATEAIKALKEAAKMSESKVYAAKSFLKSKLADVKRFPQESQESVVDELSQLQSRVEVVSQKLTAFKRETSARETSILLTEVTQKVVDAETKVQKTLEASAPLAADKLEETGVAKLKEAAEQTLEAEKMAAVACAEARKMLAAKQKEGQVKESPGYAAELVKLQGRLTAVQQELSKQRKVAVQGEKLWKSTLILQDKEDQMKQVEAEVEKAELLTTPLGDERPSNESIMEMDRTVSAVQKTLTEIVTSLESAQQSAQGTLKAQLVKLLARTRKSQSKIDEMTATTREQRERVQCLTLLQEAKARLEKVDAAFMQVAEAEVPYLKGIEILPLEESTKAVADSEAAVAAVQQVVSEARSFIDRKSLEVKGFVEAVAVAGMQELDALIQRNEEAKEKLAQFAKETEDRKRLALEQQAQAKVLEAEEAVQKTMLAAAPLAAQHADETSQDAAQEIVEKLGEAEQEAQNKLEEARKFLLERQREGKAKMDKAVLSKLVNRLNSVQVDLAKVKAAASEHEQRFVAKMLLQQVNEMVSALDLELDSASQAAAPLTLDGGKSFVVASMAKMILEALNEHCTKNGLTREDLFRHISPGAADGKVTEAEFIAYLEKVPELCSRADLAFSSEQRLAIFEQLDADKDAMISKSDFVDMFRDRYICTHEVSITDAFDIAQSKTIDTLLVDDVVEALSEPRSLDAMGLIRVEVRVLKDGTTGWATTQGNQGTTHFSPFTAYTAFIKRLDRTMSSTQSTLSKTSEFIASKSAELRECKQGPLADAKAELSTIRPKINTLRSKLEQLCKKIEEGKREHTKREEFERRKQEEKKDRKAVSLVLSTIVEKVSKVQTALHALEQAAAPFTSVSESDLTSVAKPISVRKATTEAAVAVAEAVAEAKGCLKGHEGRAAKATKGPWHDAKMEMAKFKKQLEAAEKKGKALLESVRASCNKVTEQKVGQVSAALRSTVQTRAIPIETLFAELAGEDRERISEAAFSRHLDSLQHVAFSPEQRQLLFQKSGSGGITRRSFFAMIERYFRCVKEIAITSEFDIKNSTTLRKLEPGEFVEVLDGPQSDDSLGVMRIRARALADGKLGWITAKGNQGTPFLEEGSKPCYFSSEAVTMQDRFATEGCSEVRTVKPGEVLEVVEGPRREVLGSAIRAQGKAVSDGAVGWFTVRSKQGEECVQQGKSTYTCRQGIALTNDMNIKECSVLRKLDKGEALVVLEGPVEDVAAGVTRIRAKATKDDREGWVTTKGNAGSLYVEESGRTYVVTVAMPLQSTFQSEGAEDVRMLAEREEIELMDGPTEEKSNAAVRVNVRAVTDGKTGWVSLRRETMKLWSPTYRSVSTAALTDALDAAKGERVRSLEPGETVELLEGPKEDPTDGILRLRCRAEKDGAVGWAALLGADGEALLECVPLA